MFTSNIACNNDIIDVDVGVAPQWQWAMLLDPIAI